MDSNTKSYLDPATLHNGGLEDLTVEIIERGDPFAEHLRSPTDQGASGTNDCSLDRQYRVLFPEKKTEDNIAMFIGRSVGQYVQTLFKHYYSNIEVEFPTLTEIKKEGKKTRRITSAIDIFIKDANSPSKSVVIDVKTTTKPLDKWIADIERGIVQVNWYLGVVGAEIGYLLGINYRNTYLPIKDCLAIVRVDFNLERFKQDYNEFVKIFDSFDKAELVVGKEFGKSKLDCGYCKAIYICPGFYEMAKRMRDNGYISSDYTEDENYVLSQYLRRFPDLFTLRDTPNVEYNFNFDLYIQRREEEITETRKRLLKIKEEIEKREKNE